MRRSLFALTLALLVAFPTVAPAAATQPVASPDAGSPSTEPSVAPSSDPSADPSLDPTTKPSQVPSGDPSATPSSGPSADPDPDASAGAGPSADPDHDPDPTANPDPTADASPGPSPSTDEPTEAPTADASPDPTADADLTAQPSVATPDDAHGRPDTTDRFIVMLRGGADITAVAGRHRAREGTRAIRNFSRAFRGFTAHLDREQRRALLSDPNVVAVVPDEVIELTAQTTPTGVARVGAKKSSTAAINGIDQRVDADVAIVDTGVTYHPDLNVVGGYNCATSDRTAWRDKNGHGTHVAGTVAALDNDFGVVGVAPGARIWGVRILNDDGYGLLSWYVCGLDWILAQRDPHDPGRPLFEAVNMSVTKSGSDDGACGAGNDDILHAAICRVVKGGITVVAAAANDSASASRRVPASYNEVITVSALADTDGKPGGLGGNRCYSWGTYDKDDTFANFSNYGHDVDIIAPGKCIWSTKPGNTYGYSSGTSMAAPAVTGAVALYKATRPAATPAEVREALQYLGNLGWATSTDPDNTHEKLLDVSRVAKQGTFAFAAPGAAPSPSEAGGTTSVPVNITRSTNHFERVRFSVVALPSGWKASLSPSSLLGWTAKSTKLNVTVPAGVSGGTREIRVRATSLGRIVEATIPVTVTNDKPTAVKGNVYALVGGDVGLSGSTPRHADIKVTWYAAKDPSSAIAGYEVERSSDGGAWGAKIATGASARNVTYRDLTLGVPHAFRIRARDAVGNWSPWVMTGTTTFKAVSDRSSSVRYSGSWRRGETSAATNGVRTTSKVGGNTARMTFSGRTISIVMPRSSSRGKVSIYLDGVKVKTVDTYSSKSQARPVVYSKVWKSVGTHTVTIRVAGTSGRPMVSLDGFLIGK